jgi:2-keto-3-deoxygluconate permease
MVKIWDSVAKVPGGLMIVPLIIGSLTATFSPQFLDLGGFTTALFKASALPLIALLIFATGATTNVRQAPLVIKKTGILLTAKTLIPGAMILAYGLLFGREEALPGFSVLAMAAGVMSSNGGLWMALASKYGNSTDTGAYMASVLSAGPFFPMLLLGAAGLASIPLQYLLAAILPYLLGFTLGNLDPRIGEVFGPTATITMPFFAFSLGAGINIMALGRGALGGIAIGIASSLTGLLAYQMYKVFKDTNPGVAFGIGTTAGNSAIVPALVAEADPAFGPFVPTATAAVSTSVLLTALIAPMITHRLCTRGGGRGQPLAAK